MKTVALIEMGKDGTFGIYTPDLQTTIIGEGHTVEEAKTDFANSVSEMIDAYLSKGQGLPSELQDITFEFKYDLPSFFNCFNYLNVTQLAKKAGINASLMRQYKKGQYVSEKQVSKIQYAINALGREMADTKLI